jgi:AcrR family transcriptional regulator
VRDLDQVLEVAARLFGERGYEATRLDEIADELGILKGSLYYYTSSKAELFYLVNLKRLRVLVERAAEVAHYDAPVEERLGRILRSHLNSIHEFYPESSQWFVRAEEKKKLAQKSAKRSESQEESWALHHRYEAIVAELIAEGQKAGVFRADIDTKVATLGILGACNWLTHWYRKGGRLSIEEITESMLTLLLDGLRPLPEGDLKRRPRSTS